MFKRLLATSFFVLTAIVNPVFAGQDCYGGGADVNDTQKKESKETEA